MNQKKNQEGFNPLDTPVSDPSDNLVNDYSELIEQEAFLGDTPYPTIIEGIKEQFDDYIGTEDRTDYVDTFFTQLATSYETAENDDEEDHKQEIREALDRIRDDFIDTFAEQLRSRLMITITAIEDEERDYDSIESTIRLLYPFFILEAKKTMMSVIKYDIMQNLKGLDLNDERYFQRVKVLMGNYSPLFSTMGPQEFLKLANNPEISWLFNTGAVSGNFLRKYSPKFYRNDEFMVDIINEVTLTYAFAKEAKNTIQGGTASEQSSQ